MDAAVVESTVREIQDVVREASQHPPPTDFVEIDRVSFALNRSCASLGEIRNIVFQGASGFHPEIVSSLRELHICLSRLSVEWETLLQNCHNRLPQCRGVLGRPRVSLNIPLVKIVFFFGSDYIAVSF